MKRQGDLLIIRVSQMPLEACLLPHRVLAEGEVTGHLHELDTGKLYEKDGVMYFKITQEESAKLNHPEHKTITFDQGLYKVIRQREYEPKGWRMVAD